MSLLVHLIIPGVDEEWTTRVARELSASTGLTFRLDPHAGFEGIKDSAILIQDSSNEIAGWILNDEPDDLHAECPPVRALEKAVIELHHRAPRGIALQAKWVSDKLESSTSVSIQQLRDLVRNRDLRDNVRYEVDAGESV